MTGEESNRSFESLLNIDDYLFKGRLITLKARTAITYSLHIQYLTKTSEIRFGNMYRYWYYSLPTL